jgi:transcriptional regulator with XRE-family HTH domain
MGFQQSIAKIFKSSREKAGFTQADVAQKADINVNYYARIERAEVIARGDILNRIAKALKISLKLPLDN